MKTTNPTAPATDLNAWYNHICVTSGKSFYNAKVNGYHFKNYRVWRAYLIWINQNKIK